MINLGARIKEARKQKKLTQKQLGELVDVHWNTIARWERNEIECRIDQLEKISKVTDKPLAWFFGKDTENQGKCFVEVDGVKFSYAREKNNYSARELAVLLEMPEDVLLEIEEKNRKVEMEYIHRMVFALGYPCSWFFTSESNKDWVDSDELYDIWLNTGKEKWKFKDYFYDQWEKKKMKPQMGLDDMLNWLKKTTQLWKDKTKNDKEVIENLKPLAEEISKSTISEINHFLKRRRDRIKQRNKRSRISGKLRQMVDSNGSP